MDTYSEIELLKYALALNDEYISELDDLLLEAEYALGIAERLTRDGTLFEMQEIWDIQGKLSNHSGQDK